MSLHPVTPTLVCHYGAPASSAELRDGSIALHLQLPHLAGSRRESLHLPGAATVQRHGFLLMQSGELLLGVAMTEATGNLEPASARLYRQLLQASHGWHLYRVWNYVPGINREEHGLECYRRFNVGRWQAFESVYGRHLRSYLPAASAVGIHGNRLVVAFVAGRQPARYLENPDQIPAYHYPDAYGPRSPGFSRAAMADCAGFDLAFISGTASIRGHASVRVGDVLGQLEVTLDNLAIMGRQMGIDPLGDDGHGQWHLKCYLRHSDHLEQVRTRMIERLGHAAEDFIYLQADICRRELDLEIEASRLVVG